MIKGVICDLLNYEKRTIHASMKQDQFYYDNVQLASTNVVVSILVSVY